MPVKGYKHVAGLDHGVRVDGDFGESSVDIHKGAIRVQGTPPSQLEINAITDLESDKFANEVRARKVTGPAARR
jgi:hypothetical protein